MTVIFLISFFKVPPKYAKITLKEIWVGRKRSGAAQQGLLGRGRSRLSGMLHEHRRQSDSDIRVAQAGQVESERVRPRVVKDRAQSGLPTLGRSHQVQSATGSATSEDLQFP